MPQSDGKNTLKRMAMEFDGVTHSFSVNPQEYTQDEPSRSVVTQTKAGAWIDDFGAGLPTIFIKGNTGFNKGLGEAKFNELRDMIRKYYAAVKPGQTVVKELVFHNYTDGESWIVHTDPSGFKKMRSRSNPLLFSYEMRFICMRSAQTPSPAAKTTAKIGNTTGTAVPKKATGSNAIKLSSTDSSYKQVVPFMVQASGLINTKIPKPILPYIDTLDYFTSGQIFNAGMNTGVQKRMMRMSSNPSDEFLTLGITDNITTTAINTHKLMSDPLSSVMTAAALPEDSMVYQLMYMDKTGVPQQTTTIMKLIAIECIALTLQLLKDPDSLQKLVSESDLKGIMNNLKWLSNELYSYPHSGVDVIENLRWMERSIATLLTSKELFQKGPANVNQL